MFLDVFLDRIVVHYLFVIMAETMCEQPTSPVQQPSGMQRHWKQRKHHLNCRVIHTWIYPLNSQKLPRVPIVAILLQNTVAQPAIPPHAACPASTV